MASPERRGREFDRWAQKQTASASINQRRTFRPPAVF